MYFQSPSKCSRLVQTVTISKKVQAPEVAVDVYRAKLFSETDELCMNT